MVIRVIYDNGSYDMVKASRLDDLIPTGRVAKFLRSDGWVTVGVDPVRAPQPEKYDGPERRAGHNLVAA
jgi:hypothetical protein